LAVADVLRSRHFIGTGEAGLKTQDEWTISDLMCVCISRQVINGEVVAQGLATPLVAAGYLLAWHTHAPDLYFASAIGQSVCREGASLGLADVEALWLENALNHYSFVQVAIEFLPRIRPKEFFRPAQVDSHGNFNNIAFGNNYRQPRMRLPGSGGIPDVTPILSDIYLYVPRHSKVTFVDKLDFLSGLGHHPKRTKGSGPCYLVTDLGQFDFKDGNMRITHLHPGVALERVLAKTAFELEVSSDIKETKPPSREEMHLLYDVIDPLGIRRLESLSGPKRRDALREALLKELAHRHTVESYL
jgi:acyl CoA:acetate/3-ketoacid CoA transferase beta subunit